MSPHTVGRNIAFVSVLVLGLVAVHFACTAMDYTIRLGSGFLLMTSPPEGPGLCRQTNGGGSEILGDVREYAVIGDFVVGRLGDHAGGSGDPFRRVWYGVKGPTPGVSTSVALASPPSGADVAGAWFIVDMKNSQRLFAVGAPREIFEEYPSPPYVIFAADDRAGWSSALKALGLRPPSSLVTPSRWRARPIALEWALWGLILVVWIPCYLHFRASRLVRSN